MKPLALLPFLLSAVIGQSMTKYTVFNGCPVPLNLYVNGVLDTTIPVKGNVTRSLVAGKSVFYSDVNGGNANGTGSTKVFVNQDVLQGYYYVIKDKANFNTGVSVVPVAQVQAAGFCSVNQCDNINCVNAFTEPPATFPTSTTSPPQPPLYSCPVAGGNNVFNVTFCPSRGFPGLPSLFRLHPAGTNTSSVKCLDVHGSDLINNGTSVQINDCNGSLGQNWQINRGIITQVQLGSTGLCLDAGPNPANGIGVKLWKCFDSLPAQQWNLTTSGHLALGNTGQCLDLTNGNESNGNHVQTWGCIEGNRNQVWSLA